MTRLFLWAVLATSCTRTELAAWWHAPERLQFVTPSATAASVSDQIPILVRVPKRLVHGTATLELDGMPAGDSGIMRRRWWSGKGVDYIGGLSTSGLSPGRHVLSFSVEDGHGETWTVTREFRFSPRPNRLIVRLEDETGEPRSGRVEFFDLDGVRVHLGSPGDQVADPTERDSPRSSLFVVGGEGEVYLRPGSYQVLASAGIRDGIAQRQIEVPSPGDLTLRLPRLIRTPDAVTADLHVHTALSGDSFVSDRRRWHSLIAAGVEVGVVTDHNRVRDPRPAIQMLDLEGELVLVPGVEFRVGPLGDSIGHGNAFPVLGGVPLPKPGEKTPAEVIAGWRTHGEAHPAGAAPVLIQLNHPRGIQFWPDKGHQSEAHALFSELNLEPGVPWGEQVDPRLFTPDPVRGERIADVDALEILNRFSVQGWRRVRADWFDLMNQGWFPTGTGNADSHSVELERPGFPVNLIRIGAQDRGSPDALVEAIRKGRVTVSSGPIVSLRVSAPGHPEALPGDTLLGPVQAVDVHVEVVAAPWVPVPEIRLVVDGEVVQTQVLNRSESPGLFRAEWTGRLPVDGDTWILAEAGWTLTSQDRPEGVAYARVAPGHVPIGFTNPVRVDGDGNGEWTPRINSNLPEPDTSGTFGHEPQAQEE